jgi:hypothetical protein
MVPFNNFSLIFGSEGIQNRPVLDALCFSLFPSLPVDKSPPFWSLVASFYDVNPTSRYVSFVAVVASFYDVNPTSHYVPSSRLLWSTFVSFAFRSRSEGLSCMPVLVHPQNTSQPSTSSFLYYVTPARGATIRLPYDSICYTYHDDPCTVMK